MPREMPPGVPLVAFVRNTLVDVSKFVQNICGDRCRARRDQLESLQAASSGHGLKGACVLGLGKSALFYFFRARQMCELLDRA